MALSNPQIETFEIRISGPVQTGARVWYPAVVSVTAISKSDTSFDAKEPIIKFLGSVQVTRPDNRSIYAAIASYSNAAAAEFKQITENHTGEDVSR